MRRGRGRGGAVWRDAVRQVRLTSERDPYSK